MNAARATNLHVLWPWNWRRPVALRCRVVTATTDYRSEALLRQSDAACTAGATKTIVSDGEGSPRFQELRHEVGPVEKPQLHRFEIGGA